MWRQMSSTEQECARLSLGAGFFALAALAIAAGLCSPIRVNAQTNAGRASASPSVADPPLLEPAGYADLLAKHRGKPLVVNIWASWCEPCRDEYPMIVDLAKQYEAAGLDFFGVSFDDDADMNLVRHFLARYKPPFPNYRLKPGNDAAFIRGVGTRWTGKIPTTIFYSSDGRIVEQFIGTRPRPQFEQEIKELLRASGKGAASTPTQPHKN